MALQRLAWCRLIPTPAVRRAALTAGGTFNSAKGEGQHESASDRRGADSSKKGKVLLCENTLYSIGIRDSTYLVTRQYLTLSFGIMNS